MTPKDILAANYGIRVFGDTGRQRTQCPVCSKHRRVKPNEKCLVVDFDGWEANWFCFHCLLRGSTHDPALIEAQRKSA